MRKNFWIKLRLWNFEGDFCRILMIFEVCRSYNEKCGLLMIDNETDLDKQIDNEWIDKIYQTF